MGAWVLFWIVGWGAGWQTRLVQSRDNKPYHQGNRVLSYISERGSSAGMRKVNFVSLVFPSPCILHLIHVLWISSALHTS